MQLEIWFPLQGERAHSLKKIDIKSILNSFLFLLFFSSSVSRANPSCVVATIFSNLAFLSTSVSMANLSCLLATTFSSLRFLSNSFSSPRLEWPGAVSRGLLFVTTFSFPLVVFLVLLLALSFLHLILSLSLLCSSVYEALYA